MTTKKKIAILGAGPAGLAAAYGLTATPALREQHEVTVYQVGWRAGGKCASGRAGPENRIEQNGTHYLFGCYDNTLALTRDAYAELKDAGISDFGAYETSLLPRDLLALKHFFRGKWQLWALPLPSNWAKPGKKTGYLNPPAYFGMFLMGLFGLIFGARAAHWLRPQSPFDEDRPPFIKAIYTVLAPLVAIIGWVVWAIGLAVVRLAIDLMRFFGDPHFFAVAHALAALRRVNRWAFGWLATQFVFFYRVFVALEFACTLGIGLIRDLVPSKGLSAIEPFEFRAWLKGHGASDLTLYAPFVATWYDAVAAFEDGDPARPNLSAGVSVMAIGRAMLTFKGHFAYQMRAEVGDTVIGPVFECLRRRGVKFRFFHRVRDIVPGPEGDIAEIVVERQVTLTSGDPDSYDPFATVRGLKVWPGQPDLSQIKKPWPDRSEDLESFYTTWRGETLPPLKRGEDFDDVVLAMPVASFPTYCEKLIAQSEKWQNMTQHLTGVESQTMRLYFDASLEELGWELPTPILSNYAMPFATWEDNGHLVEAETWPDGTAPKSIATLFGPLPAPTISPPETDRDYPKRQQAAVMANTMGFLDQNVGALWPKAATLQAPLQLDWNNLTDLKGGVGPTRIEGQYIRANSGPLQRYTSAKAGTAQHRLAADDAQFSNLVLAGDWTQNHYLIGSVEGAVMSGLQASRALCGHPAHIPGEDTGL